jgi:proteasome lid subunit RPN8/RPN11
MGITLMIHRSITLPSKLWQGMVDHALREIPNECCGVLLGAEGKFQRLIPMRNVRPSPSSYFMDPERQVQVFSEMEKGGEQLLGIYHSHPNGPPYPSDTDLKLAFHPDALYFIVSLEDKHNPSVGAFQLQNQEFTEIQIMKSD